MILLLQEARRGGRAPRRSRTSCTPARRRPPLAAARRPRRCATPATPSCVNAGGGSFKSQMKTRRCLRRALRAHDRRRRGRARHASTVKPLRERRAVRGARRRAGDDALDRSPRNLNPRAPAAARRTSTKEDAWPSTISKSRTSSRTSRRGGSSWGNLRHGVVHRRRASRIVGVQGWRWWQHSQAEQASVLYGGDRTAVRAQRPRQGEGRDGAARRPVRAAPATRRAARCSSPSMLFDSGDKAGAQAQLQWVIDHAERGRAARDRALPPRRGAARRQAVRRRAARRSTRSTTTPSPASTPTCAATSWPRPGRARRGARRLPDGARQARRQVAVPQLRAGEARRAGRPQRPPPRAGRRDRRRRAGRRHARRRRRRPPARPPPAAAPPSNEPPRAPAPAAASRRRGPSRHACAARRRSRRCSPSAAARRCRRGSRRSRCRRSTGSGAAAKKPGPLPEFKATVTAAERSGRSPSARRAPGFAPAVTADAVYAAATDGTIARIESGHRPQPRGGSTPARTLSAGVGADATMRRRRHRQGRRARLRRRRQAAVAGPRVERGDQPARSSPRASSPSGPATAASTRSPRPTARRKWVYQRSNPPLIVRNYAGGIVNRGGLFAGTAGGKLRRHRPRDRQRRLGRQRGHAQGRDRARAHRRRHEPARRSTNARSARSRSRGASPASTSLRGTLDLVARRVEPRRHRRATTGTSTSPTTRAPCTRSTRATGSVGLEAGQARAAPAGGPQIVGDYVAVVDVEGYLHLHRPQRRQPRRPARHRRQRGDGAARGVGRRRRLAERCNGTAATRSRDRRKLDAAHARCCPPSSSSAAPTSASRRCSTG